MQREAQSILQVCPTFFFFFFCWRKRENAFDCAVGLARSYSQLFFLCDQGGVFFFFFLNIFLSQFPIVWSHLDWQGLTNPPCVVGIPKPLAQSSRGGTDTYFFLNVTKATRFIFARFFFCFFFFCFCTSHHSSPQPLSLFFFFFFFFFSFFFFLYQILSGF